MAYNQVELFQVDHLLDYHIAGYFRRRNFWTSATILNFEELNFAQRHDFENKFSFLLWTNKSFVEFIFKDNVLNEIFKNKFPLKITCYTVTTYVLWDFLEDYQATDCMIVSLEPGRYNMYVVSYMVAIQ